MAKPRYSPAFKTTVAKAYLAGEGSLRYLAAQYGVSYSTVEDWALKYKEYGEQCFENCLVQMMPYTTFK